MATFGPLLRRTREQRRVSLDDVARETRLSKRYLVALEEEAIAKLPGGTYNRAYLKMYATFLALEPEPIVRAYLAEEERQIAASQQDLLETMNRAVDKRQAVGGGPRFGMPPAWMMAVAAAVITIGGIGAMAWYGLSSAALGTLETGPTASTTPAAMTVPAPVTPPPSIVADPALRPPAPVVPVDTPSVPAAPSAVEVESAPVAAVAGPSTSEPAPTPEPPTPASEDQPPASDAPVEADSADTATLAEAASSHLSVSGSGVGTAVVDRQLVGQADRFTAGSRVVFWTHVVGGRAGDIIDHVWLRDGSVVGAASLSVGSPDWRTQSRRVVDPAGRWAVEARDADGRVLARHEFQTSSQ